MYGGAAVSHRSQISCTGMLGSSGERHHGHMRQLPGLATALILSLALGACSQSGASNESGNAQGEPERSGLVLPDVDEVLATPVHWESGILEVFDDVALLAPEIKELRDAFVAQEQRFAEELFAQEDPEATPEPLSLQLRHRPVSWPHGAGGAGTAASVAAGGGSSMGANFMAGAMATELVNLGFIQEQSWAQLPVGESVSNGKGQSATKIDDRNAAVDVSSQHQEVKGDTIVRTDFRIKIEGTMCPAPDGEFDVTITVDQTVTATTRAGEAWEKQNVIVNAVGRLGEDAIPERYDVETAQTTTQKHADGRTGFTQSTKQRSDLNFREMDNAASTVTGQSGLTQAELDALTKQGDSRAVSLATGQMFGLFKHWLLGGCVEIKHDAPGQVEADSTTAIRVETPHRVSKAPVSTSVELTLSGEKSIDPQEFASPDTFSFTAGEEGSQASIKVTARSRQGGDQETLTIEASSERAYLAIGETDGYALTEADKAIVCDFTTWGFTGPGYTADDGYYWAFTEAGEAIFGVIKSGGAYLRTRSGTWTVERDDDDQPVAIVVSYSEGFEIVENASVTDLGAGSARFELKPVPRPSQCADAP